MRTLTALLLAGSFGMASVTEAKTLIGPDTPRPAKKRPGDFRRTVGLIVGGAGLALAAGALPFAIVAKRDYDQMGAGADCMTVSHHLTCDQAGYERASRALETTRIATAGVLAGSAAVAVGALLWASAPKHTAEPALWFAPGGGGGLALRGNW